MNREHRIISVFEANRIFDHEAILQTITERRDHKTGNLLIEELQKRIRRQEGDIGEIEGFLRGLFYLNDKSIIQPSVRTVMETNNKHLQGPQA